MFLRFEVFVFVLCFCNLFAFVVRNATKKLEFLEDFWGVLVDFESWVLFLEIVFEVGFFCFGSFSFFSVVSCFGRWVFLFLWI